MASSAAPIPSRGIPVAPRRPHAEPRRGQEDTFVAGAAPLTLIPASQPKAPAAAVPPSDVLARQQPPAPALVGAGFVAGLGPLTMVAAPSEIFLEPAVAQRHGGQLSRGRLLCVDNLSFMHTTSLQSGAHPQPMLPGTINFRQIPGTSIYGTGQPTVEGMKNVLHQLQAGPGEAGSPVHWTNLREEPVLYLNGAPFFLMDTRRMFANLQASGTTPAQTCEHEQQLKADILREAAANGGKLLVHHVQPDNQMAEAWLDVKPESLQTVGEVFEGLRAEGYRVHDDRVSVTDEKAPSDESFDQLVEHALQLPPDAPEVFNCQLGRGRTTTAMVVAELIRRQRVEFCPVSAPNCEEGPGFANIHTLVNQLQNGAAHKATVDWAIQEADSVQNLRTAVDSLRKKVDGLHDPEQSASVLREGKEYLYRYYKLVAFQAYLGDQLSQGCPVKFSQWLKAHPDINVDLSDIHLAYYEASPASKI